LFYIVDARSFGRGLNRHTLVSPVSSRKSFLARFGGLLAAAAIAPGVFLRGKSSASAVVATAPVPVRPEQRAVARQEGSY
jgi:hypothetical protein